MRHFFNFLLQKLFKGGNLSGRKLFKGGNYSRIETIPGQKLFQGGNYSRAETICGNRVIPELGIWIVMNYLSDYMYKLYQICLFIHFFSQKQFGGWYIGKYSEFVVSALLCGYDASMSKITCLKPIFVFLLSLAIQGWWHRFGFSDRLLCKSIFWT